jgi:hypothetical protein
MAKNHGARQQKKVAKLKAKRSDKRSDLIRRNSSDPTVRLQRAEKWPVVHAYVGLKLWDDGIGHLVIARQESEGRLIFGVYLVDVYCVGVKDAFWRAGTNGDFKDLIRSMEKVQTMTPISPACLAKIVTGSVDYALSFGLRPHPDYRHAAMLLAGIDPSTCPQEFTFGRDGKPFYIQGPFESPEVARAILERIHAAGGHFLVQVPLGQAPELGLEGFVDDNEEEENPSNMLEP